MSRPNPRLRPASPNDAEAIASLLKPYAEAGIVLPRSPGEIREYIENFIVAEDGQRVVGAVALRDFGDGLEEIRSLVVHQDYEGRGLGSLLVQSALELARSRSTTRLFTLTVRPRLFERAGFSLVDKQLFPQKVWSDCAKCPKQDCCDECALVLDLGTGPRAGAARL